MSEVESRPRGTRGRGSYRGGRGGYRGARNGVKGHTKSEEQDTSPVITLDDQGEVGELKRKYGSNVPLLREVCPGWSDEDLVYALNETDGNVDLAFDRISSGSISQWGEVKKKQPKSKETPLSASENPSTRGRGRGHVEGRGRGRGAERSRGRGGRATSQANGTRTTDKAAKPDDDGGWSTTAAATTESTGGWDSTPAAETTATGDWANDAAVDEPQASMATEEPAIETAPPVTKKGGWAGLFAKPPPAAIKKIDLALPESQPGDVAEPPALEQGLPPEIAPVIDSLPGDLIAPPVPTDHPEAPLELTPSKDELTEENLEQIPDASHPPPSHTAASTVASTQDPLSSVNIATPAIRPGMSGYAASALKATAATGRTPSFTRKIIEQQESVVMPSHNQLVDSTAVQFGRMGLNGDLDVDEEREDPETRTQLPDDSPAAPRASLPPSLQDAQATAPSQDPAAEVQPLRHAPGLPAAHQQLSQSSTPPVAHAYSDQYRYGQAAQKTYDPFGQQHDQSAHSQGHQPHQEPFSNQLPSQSQGPMSSVQDYSSYYGTNARDPYSGYYGSYAQTQDAQPRSTGSFGSSGQDMPSQYATSRPQNTYSGADAQGSGHNTPNPVMQGHQAHPSQHMTHSQTYGGYAQGYNAYGQQYPQYSSYGGSHRYGPNRPPFDDVRRQDPSDYYTNQYNYGQNQHYGAYNKGVYGAAQQQYSYDHSSSLANPSGYGQSSVSTRDTVYGRSGSAQPSESQQSSAHNPYGSMPDPFGRSHSGFGQQHGGSEDASKYETSKASGPSPAIGQSNRPGSTINSVSTQAQQSSGFPASQSHTGQQAFGGYPQYGGHQGQSNHPQSAYGGYGSATFANTYGAYGGGRGWTGSYGGAH